MQPTENSILPSLPVKNAREYKALLTDQIKSMTKWNGLFKEKQDIAVKKFMDAIGNLYLDYYQFHLDEAASCGLQYKSILESSIKLLIVYTIHLEHRLRSADALDEPWEIACRGRTNIEAFNAMFSESIERIDESGIEEYMQDRKSNVYGGQMPKNAPATHWWWFEDYLNY